MISLCDHTRCRILICEAVRMLSLLGCYIKHKQIALLEADCMCIQRRTRVSSGENYAVTVATAEVRSAVVHLSRRLSPTKQMQN